MWAADVGHIADRSYRQRYESAVFRLRGPADSGRLHWQATIPAQASLIWHVRSAATQAALTKASWRALSADTATGDFTLETNERFLQYRVGLAAAKGCGYPVVERVEIEVR